MSATHGEKTKNMWKRPGVFRVCGWTESISHHLSSLLEFLEFKRFGKTMLVANKRFGLFEPSSEEVIKNPWNDDYCPNGISKGGTPPPLNDGGI